MNPRTLEILIKDFLAADAQEGKAANAYWRRVSITDVLSEAGRGNDHTRKRHPHLRRLRKSVLLEARVRLMAHQNTFLGCSSFVEILNTVHGLTADLWGYGEMAVYDSSMALGAHLGHLPRAVYLHRGTRRGAANLGLDVRRRSSIEQRELPRELTVLQPYEIEDFFCRFKNELRPMAATHRKAA